MVFYSHMLSDGVVYITNWLFGLVYRMKLSQNNKNNKKTKTTQVSWAAFVIHIHNKILCFMLRGGHAMVYVVQWKDNIPERKQELRLLTLNTCIKYRGILQDSIQNFFSSGSLRRNSELHQKIKTHSKVNYDERCLFNKQWTEVHKLVVSIIL